MLRVIDILDHPHGGRILRLRLREGTLPPLKTIEGSRLEVVSQDGHERRVVRVEGFPVFGGKPSDERVKRTGRVDLHVVDESGEGKDPINLRWTVSIPRR